MLVAVRSTASGAVILPLIVAVGFVVAAYFVIQAARGPLGTPAATSVGGKGGDGWRRATLRPTYAIDLESGEQEKSDAATRDLWWQAISAERRVLGPALQSQVLLAPLAPSGFAASDGAALAALGYAAAGFEHTNEGGAVAKGLTFAVRTQEGNFAKVRVVSISATNAIEIEWRVYQAPGAHAAGAGVQAPVAQSNPSIEIPRLLDEAQRALRARNEADSAASLEQAVALARALPAGSTQRTEMLSRAGSLYWSLRRLETARDVLDEAAQAIIAAGANAPVHWELAARTHRMLGVVHRDARRLDEAIVWFGRAVDAAHGVRPRDENERSTLALGLTSNLAELASAQCLSGARTAGADTRKRLQQACEQLRNPQSVAACSYTPIGCSP